MFQRGTELANMADTAFEIATRYNNATFGPEHILFAICANHTGRAAVEEIYQGDANKILNFLMKLFEKQRSDAEIPETGEEIQKFLGFLMEHVQNNQREGQDCEAFTLEQILDILVMEAATFVSVSQALSYGGVLSFEDSDDDDDFFSNMEEDSFEKAYKKINDKESSPAPANSDSNYLAMLDSLTDVTQEMRLGKGDELVGRDDILTEMKMVLSRRRKSNVFLVGEPGVGKSALVEGLAKDLLSESDGVLRDRNIVEVSLTSLMAGTRYRGDFEARMRYLIDFAVSKKLILFLDEAHILMGTGAAGSSSSLDASNILKPALARGDLSVIFASTPSEARPIEKDKALSRRIQKIMVSEPSSTTMLAILEKNFPAYKKHHGVDCGQEMFFEIVEKSAEFLLDKRFPDKAFDVLDHASQNAALRGSNEIASQDVDKAIFQIGGINPGRPTADLLTLAENLQSTLGSSVFGQESALSVLSQNIRQAIYGFSMQACASAHLFNGPSGVGKTQAALSLAEVLGVPLVRIDMSEFSEKSSVSGLIGAPPGYVGFDEEGRLIEAALTHPRQVLLLDEVDKAHPAVFDILLQVLDAGRLTSTDGRTVSFKGVHIVMTANLGVAKTKKEAIGFGRSNDESNEMMSAVEGHFRKEFLERLSGVLTFVPLELDGGRQIIEKTLKENWRKFAWKGYKVTHTPSLVDYFAKKMGKEFSGRQLKRLIGALCVNQVAPSVFVHEPGSVFEVSVENDCVISKMVEEV